MAEQELTTLDIIEGKLRKVRGDIEARKSGTRPRSLNLTTLYCSEVPAANPSPLSVATIPATPAPSINSSVSVTSPSILVRHRPLSPPALRLQRSVSSHSQYSQHQPTPQQRRALYRQASAGSSLRRKRAYSQRRCARVCRVISEISWLLVGLRHLVVELPLLIVLALNHGVGLHFYLTLAATLAPGPATLIAVIKNGVAQGTSILHSIVRCVALTIRLESLLRLVELMVWWRGGAAWRSHVNVAQAGAGSTPQLILQVTVLGLCTRQILEDVHDADEGQIFKRHGMNHVFEYEKSSSLCDPSIIALQYWVATVSALHVAWALSINSRPKVPPNCSVDPEVWVLVRRISAVIGILANLLLSGSRMALVMLAVSSGWPTWNIAVTFTFMLSIMILSQLIRRCCGKSTQNIAIILCSLVAIEPGALSPRILARRCVIFVAGNVAMVVAIELRTHGVEASGQVYRVAVLHAAAAITGTLLLFARLRWVHSTPAAPSPRQGGKCLSQYPLQDDI